MCLSIIYIREAQKENVIHNDERDYHQCKKTTQPHFCALWKYLISSINKIKITRNKNIMLTSYFYLFKKRKRQKKTKWKWDGKIFWFTT